MQKSKRSILALSPWCLLVAAVPGLLLACSHGSQVAAPPASAPTAPAATAQPPAAAAQKLPGLPALEPPDGKWLTDEQGRLYFLQEVPKIEGWYHWEDAGKTRVRLWHGMRFEAASEDDDSIEIKIFKLGQDVSPPPAPAKRELTAEERARIAASYRSETETRERLSFEAFDGGLPTSGQWRNGFKVADMNGDGHPDIVHGPARKAHGLPNIFLGDGKGSWRRWADVRFPRLAYDYGDVAVADFNGDGRLDLALASHLRGLVVLVADGSGGFEEWSRGVDFALPAEAGSGYSTRVVEAADWNRDGRPDLISLGEGPQMSTNTGPGSQSAGAAYGVVVYLNQGDGTWVRQGESDRDVRLFGDDLAVLDLTGDGRLDIALGSSVLGHKDLLRIGEEGGGWSRAELAELRPRVYVGAVDAADFNGDGRGDLAIGYLSREGETWWTGIDLLLGRADGTWQRRGVAAGESRDRITALDSGDLDGDGKLDLAAVTGESEVWLFLGKGDGSFWRETSPRFSVNVKGCQGYDVQIVNLDADPAEELLAEFAGEPHALFAPEDCPQNGAMTAWKPRLRK